MLILFLLTSQLQRLLTFAQICTNTFLEYTERVEGLSKIEFKELLSLASKESCFIFNGNLYKQVGGVTMVSPLGPTLANAFLVYFENNWLQIVHLTLSLITTGRMLMLPLFCSLHQNI